jgi:hypothetical protein
MAFTLIGGTLGGTIITLVFLPALYALWYRIGTDQPSSSSTASSLPAPDSNSAGLRPQPA